MFRLIATLMANLSLADRVRSLISNSDCKIKDLTPLNDPVKSVIQKLHFDYFVSCPESNDGFYSLQRRR